MPRGKNYTAEELTRLRRLAEDNSDKRFIDIARLAITYGVTARPESCVADKISAMLKENETKPLVLVANETQVPMTISFDEGSEDKTVCRVNLALDPQLYEFVKIVSRASGMSMNNFINKILKQYATKNAKLYSTAFQLLKQITEDR